MKDPDLLEATGSEPLTYDEEVKMQQSWMNDDTKCTFIVHSIDACQGNFEQPETDIKSESNFKFVVEDNLDAMIGDVNLFFSELEDSSISDSDGVESQTKAHSERRMQAEIDIMIAEKEFRGKGFGRAATTAMLLYGKRKLGIDRFFCKINEDNNDSIRLFKAIGFEVCSYAACFKQVELESRMSLSEMEKRFKKHGGHYFSIPCSIWKNCETGNRCT